MSPRNAYITLKVDTSALTAACERLSREWRVMAGSLGRVERAIARFGMTPGDRHIDRICKEILAGVPGRPAEIRLIAASDFAQVLDGAR